MKTFSFFVILALLGSCSGFTPLFQEHSFLNNELRNIAITTDKKKMSLYIKRDLLKKIPPKANKISHIIKIETITETSSTVTASDRKTSGYEIITTSNIFLYKREKRYDRIIHSFEEKEITMFEMSPNQVLSTLASRNKAFEISSENLSKSILDGIMIYFSRNNNVDKK